MARGVCSDILIWVRTGDLLVDFAAEAVGRLFANNFIPTPASVRGDFTEASFAGYAAVDLHTLWGPVVQLRPGEYQFESALTTFTGTGVGQLVYGIYITQGAVKWCMAARFPVPIMVELDAPLKIKWRPRCASLSLYA